MSSGRPGNTCLLENGGCRAPRHIYHGQGEAAVFDRAVSDFVGPFALADEVAALVDRARAYPFWNRLKDTKQQWCYSDNVSSLRQTAMHRRMTITLDEVV